MKEQLSMTRAIAPIRRRVSGWKSAFSGALSILALVPTLAIANIIIPNPKPNPTPATVTTSAGTQDIRSASETDPLLRAFYKAENTYGIPARLLMAIAYAETRWNPAPSLVPTHADVGEDEDGADDGDDKDEQRKVYGIMGLKDDEWFGHSLTEAAKIIKGSNETVAQAAERMKTNPEASILGTAALLRQMAQFRGYNAGWKTDPLAWMEIVRSLSGIPDTEDSNVYLYGVYNWIQESHQEMGLNLPAMPIDLPAVLTQHLRSDGGGLTSSEDELPDASTQVQASSTPINGAGFGARRSSSPKITGNKQMVGKIEVEWDPSPNFNHGRIKPRFIIIHDTEGEFAGAVSWLKRANRPKRTSAHYVISRQGYIKKLVRERDQAWHVKCLNGYAIGIEHEGIASQRGWYTEKMYETSARLVRQLARVYHIPLDSEHIIGHDFPRSRAMKSVYKQSWIRAHGYGRCLKHDDPGPLWQWNHYFQLLHDPSVD